MGEATSQWGIRACLRRGGLSRNKVSVGEPADGSPPKKLGKPGGRVLRHPAPSNFIISFFLKKYQLA